MTAHALMVLPLALGLAASGATAQVCREASTGVRVHADAGHVRYAFADGTDGWEVGGGLSWASERVGVSATAFTTSLDGAETSPLGARAGVSFRALEVVGWSLCIDLLGGATRFSADDDSGTTVAGGGGVTVARALSLGGAELVPFGGVRGLAAAVS
ncbi:MAG TPA: hypothetical protein VK966_09850, partial [Longimicrobiales bacterium]|nr:hypothetical protein [Longimicrobiales bacterium]